MPKDQYISFTFNTEAIYHILRHQSYHVEPGARAELINEMQLRNRL